MNNTLIQIIEHNGQRAVNARELHAFLEVGKDFSSWIKKQIERCDLIEYQDYEVFTQKGENLQGGRPTSEYALSIDAAKEISMMSQCEKGKQARRYFIECEKRLQQPKTSSLLEDRLKAATWAVDFLNMNETSRLKLAKAVLEPLGLPSPDYVPCKGVMHSASELLKRFEPSLSVIKFNQKMIDIGFLKEETRKGTSKPHRFKVITVKGLDYGENQISPKNPNETQPRWYDDKFQDLLNKLLGV